MKTLYTGLAVIVLLSTAECGLAAETASATATHEEVESLGLTKDTAFKDITTFGMNSEGNIVACDGGASVIKIISPKDELLDTWSLDFPPTAILVCADDTMYVGGVGRMAKLDKTGKVVKTVKAPDGGVPRAKASAIAISGEDVFVSFGSGRSTRALAVIVRFDLDLGSPKTIATGLRGCCQRLDLATKDGTLYVAENGRHRVVLYDRDGNIKSKWGERSRKGIAGFGSCCNPMNISFGPGGVLYTSESGLGRVKRHEAEGKFLGLVGYVGVPRFERASSLAAACNNITVKPNSDGSIVYVLGTKKNVIRVLKKKGS